MNYVVLLGNLLSDEIQLTDSSRALIVGQVNVNWRNSINWKLKSFDHWANIPLTGWIVLLKLPKVFALLINYELWLKHSFHVIVHKHQYHKLLTPLIEDTCIELNLGLHLSYYIY